MIPREGGQNQSLQNSSLASLTEEMKVTASTKTL